MFARTMAVVMAAILITAVCLSGIWWITLRNQQIDARLDYLISEAEDIAYQASDLNGNSVVNSFWGYDFFGDSRTVDVHIKRLREKLPESEKYGWSLYTVRGVGYKFSC